MPAQPIAPHIREAAIIHARLLDRLIAETEVEAERADCRFVQESLREWLAVLRAERRVYGLAATLLVANIENAA
ncbi:hypothetical protein CHU95_14295 [Niveispirillum lacus]|uniref:Uncharacterized protein n=1 Tax=Niveispirillum lacus TaxID=1981099 RepID=A0A255YWG8_9PROT|nr:hypothetical protein [Niveispirillum lacus]OYQ33552.1 hypothetical protein CHU95_14295 [Niveispirillum lacus]